MTITYPIIEVVKQFFAAENWNVFQIPDRTALGGFFEGYNGKWSFLATTIEEEGRFIFYSILAEKIPESRRQDICEFITRVNYGLIIGNFEIDLDDGELRFKTSIDVQGEQISSNQVQHVVYTNVVTVDKYFPGLSKVLTGDVSPSEAIAEIRND